MNVIDIIIIAVLVIFAFKGLMRGLVNEISSLAGLFLGAWLAYRYHSSLAGPLKTIMHIPDGVAAFAAFVLILLVAGLCAHIAGNLVTTALRLVMLGGVNRLGGALIGTAEGVILLSMLFCMATAGFMPENLKKRVRASESADLLAQTGDRILAFWRGSAIQVKP